MSDLIQSHQHWLRALTGLTGVEWVHCLVLFPTQVSGKCSYHMQNWVFSVDNLLQKTVIVFFFENQISKWRLFEKRVIFDLLFTVFSYQGKVTKIPSARISLTYIHVGAYMYFAHPVDFFFFFFFLLYQFWKKNTNLSGMVSLSYDSWCWFLFSPFWNNQ